MITVTTKRFSLYQAVKTITFMFVVSVLWLAGFMFGMLEVGRWY